MKIYSFQRLFVWDCLQELGMYHPFHIEAYDAFLRDEVGDWGFLKAYAWLREEMKKRQIESHISESHLCWGWAQWWGKKKMPDKRYKTVNRFFENEPFVMLELDVPENRILLTDFDAWHFVLNEWFLGSEKDMDTFDAQYDRHDKTIECREKIRQSWQLIFDLPRVCEHLEFKPEEQIVQATFFDILYTDVQKVHFFNHGRCQGVQQISHHIAQ